MRKNAELFLKLQLIVGNLSLIFSTNEWQMGVRILFVEARETYKHDFVC